LPKDVSNADAERCRSSGQFADVQTALAGLDLGHLVLAQTQVLAELCAGQAGASASRAPI